MAFLIDRFTAATTIAITSRSPDTGAAWSGGLTLNVEGGTGRLVAPSSSDGSFNTFKNAAFPPGTDYAVRARCRAVSSASLGVGVAGRFDDTVNYTWYELLLFYNGNLILYTSNGSSRTQIGVASSAVTGAANGGWAVIELVMAGNQISAKCNGTTVIGPITNSYAGHTGKAALIMDRGQMEWIQGGTTAEADPEVVSSGTLSGAAVLDGLTIAGELLNATSVLSGEAVLDGLTIGGFLGPVPGVLVTPPLKNNTGTLLANLTGVVVNIYHASTGALIVRKSGQTSDASGAVTINDVALVPGTSYAYEVDLSAASLGRRLPVGVAA